MSSMEILFFLFEKTPYWYYNLPVCTPMINKEEFLFKNFEYSLMETETYYRG